MRYAASGMVLGGATAFHTPSGPVIGGHCIPIIAYDSTYLYAITWGSVVAISYPAWAFMAQEAWAVISGELAAGDGHGINLAALQADLSKLGS